MFTQTVTVLRAERLADSGGALTAQRDWDHATSTILSRVSVQATMSDEARDIGGVQPSSRFTMYTSPFMPVDIQVGDRVVWRGMTLDVRGEPRAWHNPNGDGVHHWEVTLQHALMTRQASSGVAAVLDAAVADAATTVRGGGRHDTS